MRNIFLSVVVICALLVAGIGGTFAQWSDSETSIGNTITTGSVDLKVNGEDDEPWGNGVGKVVDITCMRPDMFYGPIEVDLWNAGICEYYSTAYIHLKNIVCTNALPKEWADGSSTGYADPSTGFPYSGDLKPEPELVAEYGGKVDCTMVSGIGHAVGDNCCMGSNVFMVVTTGPASPEDGRIHGDFMGKLECKELLLFDLAPCVPDKIYLWFQLNQPAEEDYLFDYIDDPMEDFFPDDPLWADKYAHWEKFNDWVSWSLMRDTVTFDLEFDLVLTETLVDPPNDA